MNEALTFPSSSGFGIQLATWHDMTSLRELEKLCFPLDAWPLLDILGVLTLPNVIRLKAVEADIPIGFVFSEIKKKTAWILGPTRYPPRGRRGILTHHDRDD